MEMGKENHNNPFDFVLLIDINFSLPIRHNFLSRLAVNNNENVDMNNTQLKYPYSETKPVFYS